mmetsp:Transcript_37080/g.94921  ORF Transcript_37080/g.94921 Transcript_37080/m.94921 type:complete len:296 (-) Transcript_37080:35-922(-)
MLRCAFYAIALLANVRSETFFLQPDLAPLNVTPTWTNLATLRRECTSGAKPGSLAQLIDTTLDNVFSRIRLMVSPGDDNDQLSKNMIYASAGPLERAMPERLIALLMTLVVEIPVALIISSGSKDLRKAIGSDRYALLMAFLPLTSAISGNVGLQSSTLTTRAISHGDCTRKNYLSWLQVEVFAAALLSICMGFAVGALAGFWSSLVLETGTDFGFAMTVACAQMLSINIAGLTGTCSPLIFSFVFHQDAGKWAGPMETAIQDIAGSFAMVYMAQALLVSCIRWGLSPMTRAVEA